MSEIEKMYENAGIEPICRFKGLVNGTCFYFAKPCQEEDCKKFSAFVKEFTAEKQIELIKWLMKYDKIHGDYNDGYGFSTLNYSGKYKKEFEESLASVINNELWQDLTDAEKAQIKEILG